MTIDGIDYIASEVQEASSAASWIELNWIEIIDNLDILDRSG